MTNNAKHAKPSIAAAIEALEAWEDACNRRTASSQAKAISLTGEALDLLRAEQGKVDLVYLKTALKKSPFTASPKQDQALRRAAKAYYDLFNKGDE